MIAEGAHTGIFHVAEHHMIEGVLRLTDRTVRSIMIPRGDVVSARRGGSAARRSGMPCAPAGTRATRSAAASSTSWSASC